MTLYRFYRIVSDAGPEEYIGSTIQPLHKRFYLHRSRYRAGKPRCSSKTLFDLYGVDNCSIVLISEMECETRQHALREERRIYDERKEVIVNKRRPIVSEEEAKGQDKACSKAYNEAHKEVIKEQKKAYYEAHKEAIKAHKKAKRTKMMPCFPEPNVPEHEKANSVHSQSPHGQPPALFSS